MSQSGFEVEPFRPARWLRGAHAQTVGARYLRRRRGLVLERERLTTPDGDFVDLDWAVTPGPPDRPVVLVLHGLEGSARSGYALELYRQLARHGIEAVGLNFRGRSGEPNRGPRLYHSGETSDPELVLEHLARCRPGRPLGAVGVSLGANVLLKHLGERGADSPLTAGAAISIPFDLAAGAEHLEQTAGRVYMWNLLHSMKRTLRLRAEDFAGHADIARGLAATTFREFDEAITAPLGGFADVDDYYRRCSCGPLLADIVRPTLLLHALDDPFVPSRVVPHSALRANPALTADLPATGGHVGFVSGASPMSPTFWAESEAARFLSCHLGAGPA